MCDAMDGQEGAYPVLIVPGFASPRFQTDLVGRHLRSVGLDTISIELPWLAMGDVARAAGVLAERAGRAMEAYGCEKINIFGYSLGGVVARYYLQELEGYPALGRAAFVSSPHAGTYFGYLGFFSPAGRQMCPGSQVIRRLEESPAREHVAGKCISIFVRYDGVIVPCTSSYLPDNYNLMYRRPVSHWRAVMSESIALRASEFLRGELPVGAFPGRDLDPIDPAGLVSVCWGEKPAGARRVWQAVGAPFRTLAGRIASLLRKGKGSS